MHEILINTWKNINCSIYVCFSWVQYIFKLGSGQRQPWDFFANTVVGLGNISVSTRIWIYLTRSTLAGSRPRWCIFRTHFLQLRWCLWTQLDSVWHCLSHVRLIDEFYLLLSISDWGNVNIHVNTDRLCCTNTRFSQERKVIKGQRSQPMNNIW